MSLDLPDTVILQLLKKLVSEDRLAGKDHFDRRILPEIDVEGNEIFYHGSNDGLREGKLEPYLYVAPHPMFAAEYANPDNRDKEAYYDKDTAHKVFRIKVPKDRAQHFNQYTDPFYTEAPYREPEPDDEYEKLLLRLENPFNYVIDNVEGLELEDYEITPELIAAMKEYSNPKDLFEKLKSQRNLLDGIQRKY
jgi:hypothetical protein